MNNGTKIITATRRDGMIVECKVDAIDYDWLIGLGTWWAFKAKSGAFYMSCSSLRARSLNNGLNSQPYMHRLIVGALRGQIVDHANRDTLDNRRCNLRIASAIQNSANRIATNKTTGFRGAFRDGGVFSARIRTHGKCRHIGCFPTAIEAARAYDRAAIELHGEFAVLNFPNEYAKAG